MKSKKETKRRPGRPWANVARVEPRIARAIRFPPELFALLERACKKMDVKRERFVLDAVEEKIKKVLEK